MKPVIAIDGTFASGKGTLGKRLAAHLSYAYMDTGKLYRAAAARALAADTALDNEAALALHAAAVTPAELEDLHLKSGEVGAAASKVAIFPAVREAFRTVQRHFAQNPGRDYLGAILDGRDIGTVICPNADVKLFVDAEPEERAHRRHTELVGYGETVTYAETLAALRERDDRDRSRAESPLHAAENALLLDTTDLSIDAAFTAAIAMIKAALQSQSSDS